MQLDHITQQCFINMEGKQQHMDHKEMSDPLCMSKITSYLSCGIPQFIFNKLQETYKLLKQKNYKMLSSKVLEDQWYDYYLRDDATTNATGSYYSRVFS